jgi:hypothetical protein
MLGASMEFVDMEAYLRPLVETSRSSLEQLSNGDPSPRHGEGYLVANPGGH